MSKTLLKRNKNKKTNGAKKQGKFMEVVSKMSRGFMIPIAILPIAGMLLGIGGSITGYPDLEINNYGLWCFGNVLSVGGDMIFGNLPVLFAVALAITFTKDAGGSGLAALVGYIVFNAFQSAFIDGNKILWFITAPGGFVDKNLGITSMATSVFGGICIGAVAAYIYNRFSIKQLPGVLSFFSGNRLVPIVMFAAVFPIAIIFLLIWPWVGKALSWFGTNSSKAPGGLDSFFYGFGERTLLPFGLHHVFYLPLWQTAAGGSLALSDHATSAGDIIINGHSHAITTATTWADVLGFRTSGITHTAWDTANGGHPIIQGDQYLWQAAHGAGVNFVDLESRFGINVGRFQQNYPIYLGALPAACLAMWFCASSENKKQAAALLGTAAGTSFVTGITEPVEYTFLFIAPALFWGFHNIMSGLSALLLNVTGAHIGVTFSSGFIDLIIYGAVPVAQGTNFWWAFVFSAAFFPIYFIVFTWAIKRFDLKTPGRNGSMMKMMSKKDFKLKRAGKSSPKIQELKYVVASLGGEDNIEDVTACATRLRVDIKDKKLISEDGLKKVGASGVVWSNNHHIQAIFGGKAEIYSNLYNRGGIDYDADLEPVKESINKPVEKDKLSKSLTLSSPAKGKIVPLSKVPDDVFAKKMMGDGAVIEIPKKTKKADVLSPVAGEVVASFEGHAFGIKTSKGVEVLVHIGVDTVNLKGKGFTPNVKKGDKVKKGQSLVNVDFELLRKEVKYVNPIVIITSGQKVNVAKTKIVKTNDDFLTVE